LKEVVMKHLVNWAEIPVIDMGRAKAFYEKILGAQLQTMSLGKSEYSLFPSEDKFNSGALAHGDGYVPGSNGVMVYLDGGNDLDTILSKVKTAGGKVILPKTYLSKEAGWIGLFSDTEGNRIGLQHM
jgi:predicted enzyme related to lactoylglutathione lyase